MLILENISTGYGKKQVLFNVSIDISPGEIALVVGSNGSGKSTLLKSIFGLLPQWFDGKVFFDGENMTNKPSSQLIKSGLMYIPQKNNLFEDLSVNENLIMAGLTLSRKVLNQRIEDALSKYSSLKPLLKRKPMNLSGGERQLLTFAMAALHKPKMILIDEPFTGLSPKHVTFVAENLKSLRCQNGTALVIVEHRVKECIKIADKIVGLKLGKVFTQALLDETFDISDLNPIFI